MGSTSVVTLMAPETFCQASTPSLEPRYVKKASAASLFSDAELIA